jgi:MOSC domain-containing protein YiiM
MADPDGRQPMGEVVSIAHKPEGIDPRPPDHYARVPLGVATLQAGRGIVTDRKGGNPDRQLNVMARETLEQLSAEGLRTAPGEMGEQIVVSGMGVDRLAPGIRLQLGEEAVIEVIKPRTGCDRLRRIQGCTPPQAGLPHYELLMVQEVRGRPCSATHYV